MFSRLARAAIAASCAVASVGIVSPPAQAAEPTFLAYSFPNGGLVTSKGESGYPDTVQLTRVGAVLAVPAGPGPHPVALIVHGGYMNCINKATDTFLTDKISTISWPQFCQSGDIEGPQPSESAPAPSPTPPRERPLADTGAILPREGDGEGGSSKSPFSQGSDYVRWDAAYAHMVKTLARNGIAAMAVDLSVKDSFRKGNPNGTLTTNNLLATHLDVLKKFNAGDMQGVSSPRSLQGTMDFNKMALIGHSNGGDYVLDRLEETSSFPGLKAIVGLQPVTSRQPQTPVARPVPTFVIYSECDEQINPDGEDNLRPAVKALGQRMPKTPLLSVNLGNVHHLSMLSGGNHTEGLVRNLDPKTCPVSGLIKPEISRPQAANLAAEFLKQVLIDGKTSGEYTLSLAKSFTFTPDFVAHNAAGSVKPVRIEDSALPPEMYAKDVVYQEVPTRVLPEYKDPQ